MYGQNLVNGQWVRATSKNMCKLTTKQNAAFDREKMAILDIWVTGVGKLRDVGGHSEMQTDVTAEVSDV